MYAGDRCGPWASDEVETKVDTHSEQRDRMISLIRAAVDEIGAELEASAAQLAEAPDEVALYGSDGPLSSLELVSVLIAVEQAIEDHFGVAVNLADDQAMSETRSPFRSVGSLAELACARIAA